LRDALLIVVSGWLAVIHPGRAFAACDDLLAAAHPGSPTETRSITPEDLATIRQIGQPEYLGGPSALSTSPDGKSVAFIITRGDPAANAYCVGLAVLDLATNQPRLLDTGGELILSTGEFRGSIWTIGFPALVRPEWSPDGRSIAWLRRDRGIT